MNVIEQITAELRAAMRKFPTWPTDPLHALAVLGEEFGELTKATLQLTYEPHKSTMADVREEAIQTAAMALRFAMSLDVYQFSPSQQHQQSQEVGEAACIDEELLHRMSLLNEGVLDLDELVNHFIGLGLEAEEAKRDTQAEELF
jgi:NTP pyrophosphatase (non-canonical NTP hydrolase)